MTKYNTMLFNINNKSKIREVDIVTESKRTYNIEVELFKPSSSVVDTGAIFIEGDRNSSVILASVIYSKKVFDLTNYTASINVKENSKLVETFICDIVEPIAGKIEINLPNRYVDDSGNNTFEIVLQKDDTIIISPQYSYIVIKALGEGYVGDDTDATALQQIIEEVHKQYDKLQAITEDLNLSSTDIDDIINMIG